MPKKCKNCGTAVEDTAKICPSCSNLAFEETAKFELSQDQILELALLKPVAKPADCV
jgi:uncharacterized OB-fold protein